MDLTREHFRAFISHDVVDYPDKSASMDLNLCMAMKHHPIAI